MLNPLTSPVSTRSCEEKGRGVVGDGIEYCDDLELIEFLLEWYALLWGLGDVKDRLILAVEDLRRREGVLGDEGIQESGGLQYVGRKWSSMVCSARNLLRRVRDSLLEIE